MAQSIGTVLEERLPWQRKTRRENLALLVTTMLSERSANLMSLAAALPRQLGRVEPRGSPEIDLHYQWIARVLANPLIECDAVMLPFAREVLARAQAEAGPGERVDLILDQSRASEQHQILMLALRCGERALPLAWRVEETESAIGFGVQKGLLDTVAAWLARWYARAAAWRPVLWHACADRPLPVAGLELLAAAERQSSSVDRRC